MAFFLKTLPCLELQKKGSGHNILVSQPSRHLIVSYPIKSVSGREKGMREFYAEQFVRLTEGQKWKVNEMVIGNELVYVIKKTDARP